MDEFAEVYDTRTGIKSRVPRHWVGDPVLGRFIAVTAEQRELDGAHAAQELVDAEEAAAAEMAEPTVPDESVAVQVPVVAERPDESWSAERIKTYADGAGIDLTGAKGSKAEMVARITEVLDAPVELNPQDPDGAEPADETPVTGDEEN